MDKVPGWLQAIIGIGTAVFIGLITVGTYYGLRPSGGDPSGWFLSAALTIGLVVVVCLFYFGLQPLLLSLQKWRLQTISARRAEIAAIPRSASAAKRSAVGALSIISADYGAGDQRADVTTKVAAQVAGARVVMDVSNETLGPDPAPGLVKELRVTYVVESGDPTEVSVTEGQRLSLP